MKSLGVIALCLVTWTGAQKGPCFDFSGDAYLEFEPDNFDLSNSAHYSFNFKTTQEDGIILYAKGSHDYEIIYIREGILNYDLVNPEASGVGSSYGAHLESSHRVNNGTLISVEVFRNRRVRRGQALMPGERSPIQTGMVLKVAGEGTREEEHLMRPGRLVGVHILLPVYIGGFVRDLSSTVRQFKGQISDIREKKTNKVFIDPSRNFGVSRCLLERLPQ